MSSKRSRKPLSEKSTNKPSKRPKVMAAATGSDRCVGPEGFKPLEHTASEHAAQAVLPPDIELTPIVFFSLFWTPAILEPIVEATNIYAELKRSASNRRKGILSWKPLTVSELQKFLSISIFRGINRLPSLLSQWKYGRSMLPMGGIGLVRYMQIKRYLNISIPPSGNKLPKLPRKDWWKKLEPLSSYFQHRFQELYLPSTNVAVDEMMINFTERSTHTIRLPGKPIPVGYKVLVICDSGYTLNWLFTSRVDSIACLEKHPDLSPTGSAVLQLCHTLNPEKRHVVYMDNAFSTVPLFRELRKMSVGAVGTTRINSAELPDLLKDKTMSVWNSLTGCQCIATTSKASSRECESEGDVLCLRWEDNNIVRLLTTVYHWNEYTLSERRKPRTTSTNAALARQVFGNQERKTLPIPKVVNDYNHHMNSVDLADQRRAGYTTHIRACRNWLCLFFFLLDISLVNSHILYVHARTEAFNRKLDTGEIQPDQILLHQLARPYSAELFRRQLVKQLVSTTATRIRTAKRCRTRHTYSKKSNPLYFSKYNRTPKPPAPSTAGDLPHQLRKINSRRSCCICRLDYRCGETGGRQRPKLTSFECSICSPPIALCGPDNSSCFIRWHTSNS